MVPHLFGGIGLIAFGEIRLAGGDTGTVSYTHLLSGLPKGHKSACRILSLHGLPSINLQTLWMATSETLYRFATSVTGMDQTS